MPRIKKYKLQHFRVPGSTNGTGIPTPYFRDVLERLLTEVGQNLGPDAYGHPQGNHANGSRWNGALIIVAERAAEITNRGLEVPVTSAEGVSRRISSVLAEDSEITDLGAADAVALACGKNINQLPLPVLPGGRDAAREMVESHLDATGEKMTLEERESLIHALDRFTLGFANGPRIFNDPSAKLREKKRRRTSILRRTREARVTKTYKKGDKTAA